MKKETFKQIHPDDLKMALDHAKKMWAVYLTAAFAIENAMMAQEIIEEAEKKEKKDNRLKKSKNKPKVEK
jgi:hypothetical protein